MSVRAFLAEQDRDAEPGVRDHVPLDFVEDPRRGVSDEAVGEVLLRPRIRAVETVKEAEPAPAFDLAGKFLREGERHPVPRIAFKAVKPLIELADLFPQGEAGAEVGGALRGGQSGVFEGKHGVILSDAAL